MNPAMLKKMHPEIELLLLRLREATQLLQAHQNIEWADWLMTDARMILQLDFYGIEHLLSAFGGMGSLNDVVLQRYDGNSLIVPSAENEQFSVLRQEIYSLASKLKSEEF
ncbi:hypothetical protein Herbaro_02940 [Herbaspirillum sp. WKF16]|uniref:DUF6966 domain-containing protein n=1 Tax=Herbaspirillum sp. WKF16 TaxID=3028312 RepID=UPI0023A9700D|nr:hypothetical protein [Herbaspirillum sp. WKF16]WDZ96759.1 hypothetical protein Herbaro_02940 [Herbaspirillum sp. WKF16]